jgi:hypothetical protein
MKNLLHLIFAILISGYFSSACGSGLIKKIDLALVVENNADYKENLINLKRTLQKNPNLIKGYEFTGEKLCQTASNCFGIFVRNITPLKDKKKAWSLEGYKKDSKKSFLITLRRINESNKYCLVTPKNFKMSHYSLELWNANYHDAAGC